MANAKYARDPDYGKPPRWGRLYDRYFPDCTDPWSRHVKLIAEGLRAIRSPTRRLLMDAGYEPDHWAHSMEVTIERLWETRQKLAEAEAEIERLSLFRSGER